MRYRLFGFTTTLLLAIFSIELAAQNEIVHIYGQLKDFYSKEKLDYCLIEVFKEGAIFDNLNADTSGKYGFKLLLGFEYTIKYSKADYLAKSIIIDTRSIPDEEKAGGFDMNIDGTLFPSVPGFRKKVLDKPVARCAYQKESDGLIFDFEYSAKRQKEITNELERAQRKNASRKKSRK